MPPTSAADLPHAVGYEGSHGSCRWQGRVVGEAERFGRFLRDRVRERVRDEDEFADELGALATTGMATEFLEEFLAAQPFPQDWEIGEALAECALELEVEREICWPWNTVRDRRTPRASLPGADLVGFCRQGGDAYLLFGEVKTSSDEQVPPRVMRGDRGMPWQLADTATRLDVQHALLRWLRARCQTDEHLALYREATSRYLRSRGASFLLMGVLLRDTSADARDLRDGAITLAGQLPGPTRIELLAWYLPVPIEEWVALLDGGPP